jgi:predicted nucleic acid-binding protein
MKNAYLVDTNVLVYAYDRGEPDKQRAAIAVLSTLAEAGTGVLSPQILGEFFVVATRRLSRPLSLAEAERSVTNYLRSWQVCDLTPSTVLEAVVGVRRHRLSYWGALVWATARLNQIPTVLSEDFANGRIVDGVRFTNPLTSEFDPRSLEGRR